MEVIWTMQIPYYLGERHLKDGTEKWKNKSRNEEDN